MPNIIPIPSGFLKKQSPADFARNQALGIETKSASPYGHENDPETYDYQRVRRDRYRLQNHAKKLAFTEGLKAGLEFPANWHRVAKCNYERIAPTVDVKKSTRNNKAFYSGLAACGSVWACPCCTAKIQESRRVEAAKMINWAYKSGYRVMMVTLTQPHYYYDDLKLLLANQQKSLRALRSGKAWQGFKERIGFEGLVRSLEVTHGKNGFHPHTHELWIVDKKYSYAKILKFVQQRWKDISKKYDLIPYGKMTAFYKHSVDIKDNVSTSDYLLKMDDTAYWGADREIAKAAVKSSTNFQKGVHPFELLSRSMNGDAKSGQVFVTYVEAFKGKRQMFWSHGLKDRVGVQELTDEELAMVDEPEPERVCFLDHHQWQVVRQNNAQAVLLDIAESLGADGVDDWLKHYGLNLYRSW